MGSKTDSRARAATAFHEAGHAVMAWALGLRLKKATIISSEDLAGACHLAKSFRGQSFETGNPNRVRLRTEKHILVSLAGPIAQQRYNRRSFRRYQAQSDFEKVARLAQSITGSSRETDAYVRWLEIRTEETLKDSWHWRAVKALAAELIHRRTLSGKQVKKVILQAMDLPQFEELGNKIAEAAKRKRELESHAPSDQSNQRSGAPENQ